MSTATSPSIAESLARCSVCGQIRVIVAIDRACELKACRDCVPHLNAAGVLIELTNKNHNARLGHPKAH